VKTPNDQARIAKVKRLRGETCTGSKHAIRSRGFAKPKAKHKWPSRPFGKQKEKPNVP
jgi:hypothetical protein